MTQDEYHRLELNNIYEFNLYHGPKVYGYMTDLNGQYYVVMPRAGNQGKSAADVGTPVKLEQIETYRIYNRVEQQRSSIIQGSWGALPSSQYKATKLVILGAGASFDYTFEGGNDLSKRPPLSKDIFSDTYKDILNLYPGARALSGQFLRVDNIEQQFERLWKRVEDFHHAELAERLINTQFYIHALFSKISRDLAGNNKNNYNNLVELADYYVKENPNEYILFVNFNYDLLLEEALTSVLGYSYNTIEEYVDFKNKKILLFKPHGSCNWVKSYNGPILKEEAVLHGVRTNIFASNLMENHISFSKLFDCLDERISITNKVIHRFYPWLLLPYSDKDEFVMPSFHVNLLTHFLKDINEIVIIGWKGTENHFLKLLKDSIGSNNQPKIIYANGGDKSIEDTFINKQGLFKDKTKWVEFSGITHGKNTFSSLMDWFVKTPPLFSKVSV